jgi:hypothetical protein
MATRSAGLNFSAHNAGNVALTCALARENIPFSVIHRNRLSEPNRHFVIFLSNVEVLSEAEATALREYVLGGGGLVITHRTGLRDRRFQPLQNFALADLMGADYVEQPAVATSFAMIAPEHRKYGFFRAITDDLQYFDAHGPMVYVKPRAGAETLGVIAIPRRPYNDDGWPTPGRPATVELLDAREPRQATIGHQYAPEIRTAHPVLVLHPFGKGRVVYYAGLPSYDYIDDTHDLIVAAMDWAAGGRLAPSVRSDAPGPVEIVTFEQTDQDRVVAQIVVKARRRPTLQRSNRFGNPGRPA